MEVGTVGVLAEVRPGERRVALVPDGVRRLAKTGLSVIVERGAGVGAQLPDEAYRTAGAEVAERSEVLDKGQLLLCVHRPPGEDLERLPAGRAVAGLLDPQSDPAALDELAARGVLALSMERVPRTVSRAQAVDVLTSQAGVAGYHLALVAANTYGRYFPMLITAAGTSRPARVLVLGAGVAGLSAIATARRLGALVTAYDVRPDARREVESLGARFLELSAVGPAAGEGGYARALTAEEQAAQQAELESHLTAFDVVITTAAVPGRRPPQLLTAAALAGLAPGSVVVDGGAGPLGGNVEGSLPGSTATTERGVTLIGVDNGASGVPGAASDALSANYTALIGLLVHDGRLEIDPDDEVLNALVVASRQEGTGERVTPL
jgi:NAD(P) transhydrogenase subunit alpha